jgi:low affinity Fe/Cu permease
VKLDQLLRTTRGAHNALLGLEELEDEEFDRIRMEYTQIAGRARERLRRGQSGTEIPNLE